MDESNFQSVTNNNLPLPERAADQITRLIINRNLQSGDKLPNEFELGALNQNRLLKETIVTHRAIVDAIVAHDSEMSRIAMIQHLLIISGSRTASC